MCEKEKVHSSVRRLDLWLLGLCILTIVLIPTITNPTVVVLNPQAAFYPAKFSLLMQLSVLILLTVLGVSFLQRRVLGFPILIPVLIFLGFSALSTLASQNPLYTLVGDRYDGLLTLGAGILLFYATSRSLDSWGRVRLFLIAVTLAAIVISIYGVVQHFGLDPVPGWGIPWYAGTERAFSTIGNPLHLAAYLTLAMGATAALYFCTNLRWERILWLLVLALLGACWLYTYARGAMLGVGLTFPILLWLSYRKMKTVRPLLLPTAVLAISIVVASQFGGEGASHRVTDAGGDSALSAAIRLYIWRDTVPTILERPLLGHGPDNFAEPFERYEGEDLKAALFNPDTGVPDTLDKAHNEFLQVTATTGFLGLAAYLWVLVAYFRSAYRSGGWPIIVLSGGTLAYVLQLQTSFSTIATGITFWAILGVSVAIMRLQEWGEAVAPNERPEAGELRSLRSLGP